MIYKIITKSFFLTILSFMYSYSGYNGLLLPSSTNDLLTMNSDYRYSKQILLDSSYNFDIASSFLLFPHEINIGNFQCNYKIQDYQISSSISLIQYGDFIDSESQYSFSSSDYILKHTIYKKLNKYIHSSINFNYISSQIDNYTSTAITTKFNIYYHYQRLLIESFASNYGTILNPYTSFVENLPISHGISIYYLPKYIKSIISITYNIFDDYNTFNLKNELLMFNNFSIILGYHSIAHNLYSGDFNNDFLIGMSAGGSFKYQDYMIDMGIKNIGPMGIISSCTISKSIN